MAAGITNLFSEVVHIHTITPQGVEKFRSVVSDPAALEAFLTEVPKALDFLKGLSNSGDDAAALAAQALAAPGAVWRLANKDQAEQTSALINTLPRASQAAILAAPGAVRVLADNGQAEQTLALIKNLPPESQAAVLAAQEAVWVLAFSGQAAQTLALINTLPRASQAAVLAAPGAIWALANKGQAAQMLYLLLATMDAVTGQARDDLAIQIVELIQEIPHASKAFIYATLGVDPVMTNNSPASEFDALQQALISKPATAGRSPSPPN